MREIKFRVWDKKGRRMCLVAKINFAYLRVTCYEKDKALIGYEFYFKDIILMQYTGLKDKGGKEIYEGDIVELRNIDDDPENFTVVWEEIGYFTLKPHIDPEGYIPTLGYFTDNDLNDSYYTVEVIGNIYENPDLASKKTNQE